MRWKRKQEHGIGKVRPHPDTDLSVVRCWCGWSSDLAPTTSALIEWQEHAGGGMPAAKALLETLGWTAEGRGKRTVKMTKSGHRPIALPEYKGRAYPSGLTSAILREAGTEGSTPEAVGPFTVDIAEEDGLLWAEVVEVPGCFAVSGTRVELFDALSEALSLVLGRPVGLQPPTSIPVSDGLLDREG
jgi:predicted RNase H-like HicB family nuclease